jgi:hypothetical protein
MDTLTFDAVPDLEDTTEATHHLSFRLPWLAPHKLEQRLRPLRELLKSDFRHFAHLLLSSFRRESKRQLFALIKYHSRISPLCYYD